MNGTKVAAPSIDAGIGAPPIGYDHGSSNGETVILPKNISHFGGWGGPRLTAPSSDGAGNTGPRLRPQ
jgi:hypothetical protein